MIFWWQKLTRPTVKVILRRSGEVGVTTAWRMGEDRLFTNWECHLIELQEGGKTNFSWMTWERL